MTIISLQYSYLWSMPPMIRGQSRSNLFLFSFPFMIMKNCKNCYEYTRFRKKPAGGDRFIKKNSNILDYNAWYCAFVSAIQKVLLKKLI